MSWEPIETAPRGQAIVGLRKSADGKQPAFVGEVYDLRTDALIDKWTGRWAACSHWMPLPAPPVSA
jgi:hypothetical protein